MVEKKGVYWEATLVYDWAGMSESSSDRCSVVQTETTMALRWADLLGTLLAEGKARRLAALMVDWKDDSRGETLEQMLVI